MSLEKKCRRNFINNMNISPYLITRIKYLTKSWKIHKKAAKRFSRGSVIWFTTEWKFAREVELLNAVMLFFSCCIPHCCITKQISFTLLTFKDAVERKTKLAISHGGIHYVNMFLNMYICTILFYLIHNHCMCSCFKWTNEINQRNFHKSLSSKMLTKYLF